MPTRKKAEETAAINETDPMDAISGTELNAVIEKAIRIRDGKMGAARQEFLAPTRAEAEQPGLSSADLASPEPKRRSSGSRASPASRYRYGSGEWSGLGRLPRWLTIMEAEGRNRDEFLIEPNNWRLDGRPYVRHFFPHYRDWLSSRGNRIRASDVATRSDAPGS